MDTGPNGDYLFDAPMFVDFSAPKFTSGDLNESTADVWFGMSPSLSFPDFFCVAR
jgi:hypothetical protein